MADELMNMFMTMGTSEHDALIEQFVSVIPEASHEAARFFLEANAWSLQPALASFFDNGGVMVVHSQEMPLSAELVCDVTIGEGEEIPPNTSFEKTWRVRNNGPCTWPHGCTLQFIQGERMGAPQYVTVPSLAPGETADVSVSLVSPRALGYYAGSWRLCSPQQYFGEEIWVVITVAEGGLLPLTQQMHAASVSSARGSAHAKRVSFSDYSHFFSHSTHDSADQEMTGGEDDFPDPQRRPGVGFVQAQGRGGEDSEDPNSYFFPNGNTTNGGATPASSPQRGQTHSMFSSPFKQSNFPLSFASSPAASGVSSSASSPHTSIPSFGSLSSHRFGSRFQMQSQQQEQQQQQQPETMDGSQ